MGLFVQSGSVWGIMPACVVRRGQTINHTLKQKVKLCPKVHTTHTGTIKIWEGLMCTRAQTHTRLQLSPSFFRVFTFSTATKNMCDILTLKHQTVWCCTRQKCLVLVGAGVYKHTNHAVERKILNSFLVWTQWRSTKWHRGVEWWQTRTDTEEEREY